MISLDLAKAFDCMPFGSCTRVFEKLEYRMPWRGLWWNSQTVNVHSEAQWAQRARKHEAGSAAGLSVGADVLTAWTIWICRRLGVEWCRTHSSLFADDVHGHWTIRSCAQFHEARERALLLIEELHRSGMKVNFDKSAAVLLLRGSAAAGLKQRFVKWHKDRYVLLLGTDRITGREVRLPLEDKMEYLGAILSYGPMEAQTVAARASRAWANYTKLRPMPRTTSAFSTKQKVKLFKACVVPAMLYGIIGVGVTAASLRVYDPFSLPLPECSVRS